MNQVSIVYWSGTGNTQAMAAALADGVTEAGGEANMTEVGSVNVEELVAANAFALGCPSMGSEELEEGEMEPFIAELEGKVSGKQILLFGSYGWGDGEWMRTWVDRMTAAGATVVGGEGMISQDAPDEDTINALKEAGKSLTTL